MTFSITARWEAVFKLLVQLEDRGATIISVDLSPSGDYVVVKHDDLRAWLGGDVTGLVGRALTAGTHWTVPVEGEPGGPVVRLVAIQRHPHVVDPETLYA